MSALGDIFDAIVAEFAAEASSTSVVFGAREKARQINQGTPVANRVVVEPLDGDGIGILEPARYPGGDPKHVARMTAGATIYVWAYDGSTSEAAANERLQYEAALVLLGRVIRAIWGAREGQVQYGRVRRVNPDKRELVLGQEWAFTLTTIDDLDATADLELIRSSSLTTTFVFPAPEGA